MRERVGSGPMVHRLKCWRNPFQAMTDGIKNFEWRVHDRPFQVGDFIVLQEWDPEVRYTGRELTRRIDYIMTSGFGIPEGYCILSWSVKGL